MKVMFAAVGSEIISLEALSAMLKRHGHQCALAFDRAMFDDKQYFTVPFLARIFDDSKQVVKDIVDYKPDLLAFSVFADNFQWCLDIARRVKRECDVPVIMGGAHPTSVPEVCIAEDCVDIVCLGDGEYPLLELVEGMAKGRADHTIKNMWFKTGGAIIKNPTRASIGNLDELPMLDKELFEKFIPISSYYLTVTNKGCIAACAYCSQNFYARWEKENALRPFYRERSVQNVMEELRHMKRRYDFKRVDIKNNVLAASKAWTLEFAKRYKDEVGVPFRIMGHPRTIDHEISRALKDAGCWHVQIGIESLNPEIRREWLRRDETNEDISRALEAMEEVGLNYSVDLMVGLPGESDSDIINALEFLAGKKNLIRASVFWLKYLPSVEITRRALSRGYIGQGDLEKINKGLHPNYLSTGSVENKEVKERLLNFQLLFRMLPIMPASAIRRILRGRYYRFFKYLPQIPIIIMVDVMASIARKDHWAIYAIYSYAWELKRRAKRFLNIKTKETRWVHTKLVKEINRIFHQVEAGEYDARHPEIMSGELDRWRYIGGRFIKPLSNLKTISILDVGSGTGFVGKIILECLKKGDTLVCYDLSMKMLTMAKEKLNSPPSGVRRIFVSGDAESLPFADERFDVVTANAIFHHLPNYQSLLKEIDRVIKKDGLLMVSHEQNSDFFKSGIFCFLASFYKFIGGGMKISKSFQKRINDELRGKKLIDRDLSRDEIMGLVDYHSTTEQDSIFIDSTKGLSSDGMLKSFFEKYSILESAQYSTFFHRPFLERHRFLQFGLKALNGLFLNKKGPLFSFIIKKN